MIQKNLIILFLSDAISTTTTTESVTNLEGSSGKIMSKNFLDSYEPDTNCQWNINVDKGRKIKLTFFLFNVRNHSCFYSVTKSMAGGGSVKNSYRIRIKVR